MTNSIHAIEESQHGMRWEVRWHDPADADMGHDVERTRQFKRKTDAKAFQRKVDEIHAEWAEQEGTVSFPDGLDLNHPRSHEGIVTALSDLLSLLYPGRSVETCHTDNDPDGRSLPAIGQITWRVVEL